MPKHKQINAYLQRQLSRETRLTINLLKSSYFVDTNVNKVRIHQKPSALLSRSTQIMSQFQQKLQGVNPVCIVCKRRLLRFSEGQVAFSCNGLDIGVVLQ